MMRCFAARSRCGAGHDAHCHDAHCGPIVAPSRCVTACRSPTAGHRRGARLRVDQRHGVQALLLPVVMVVLRSPEPLHARRRLVGQFGLEVSPQQRRHRAQQHEALVVAAPALVLLVLRDHAEHEVAVRREDQHGFAARTVHGALLARRVHPRRQRRQRLTVPVDARQAAQRLLARGRTAESALARALLRERQVRGKSRYRSASVAEEAGRRARGVVGSRGLEGQQCS